MADPDVRLEKQGAGGEAFLGIAAVANPAEALEFSGIVFGDFGQVCHDQAVVGDLSRCLAEQAVAEGDSYVPMFAARVVAEPLLDTVYVVGAIAGAGDAGQGDVAADDETVDHVLDEALPPGIGEVACKPSGG